LSNAPLGVIFELVSTAIVAAVRASLCTIEPAGGEQLLVGEGRTGADVGVSNV
jgi:hypothetical protein